MAQLDAALDILTSSKTMKICIVGASGKLGRYMIQHALDRGYEVVGVCRPESVEKLADFGDRITVIPGRTNDREVIRRAVAGCEGVLTVLAPWGMQHYASGTAQAVLDFAKPDARLVFSCGSDLEEGESQGLPVWSRHVGDPVLASNRTRRIDFALFMVDVLTNDDLVQEAPAIVGAQSESARKHWSDQSHSLLEVEG